MDVSVTAQLGWLGPPPTFPSLRNLPLSTANETLTCVYVWMSEKRCRYQDITINISAGGQSAYIIAKAYTRESNNQNTYDMFSFTIFLKCRRRIQYT